MMENNRIVIGFTSLFVLFLIFASVVSIYREGAFLVPGLAPTVYREGSPVVLYVNKVTSTRAPIPFRYHDLPVCTPPDDQLTTKSENLGEIITGNRIETSLYKLKFLEPVGCQELCVKDLTSDDQETLKDLIHRDYLVHWQVDGLPVTSRAVSSKTLKEILEIGFPLGFANEDSEAVQYAVLNNHVNIKLYYAPHVPLYGEKQDDTAYNIVKFEVEPVSIDVQGKKATCKSNSPRLDLEKLVKSRKVTYSYSVTWIASTTKWTQRWQEYYSQAGDGQVHWVSIINSLLIVFFLTGMVAMIMTRILNRDLKRYSEVDPDEVEETGWKLVSRDVFRPPQHRMFFSVLVGSGAQVIGMAMVTMALAVLGFQNPSNQGSVLTAVLVLFVWMGALAGYSSTRLYQYFGGERITRNTLFTAVCFPGTLFGIAFFLNFFLWYKHSSGAFPFLTMSGIIALWFCISIPLCFLGSRFALRREPIKPTVTPNHIARQIPTQPWYMNSILSVLMGGILPFGAVFIEIYFIMSSIWLHKYYYLFGFLFLVYVILLITCAEIAIVMVYFQLVGEDWKWWWRSFLTPGSSALYLFGYAIFYYVNGLLGRYFHYSYTEMDGFVPTLLYFGYTLILCLFFFVLTGAIGFYSCHWFVRRIYSAIRQD